jgi:8-oxo-dGTP pyrophosphatase MutT (NUDIX family)
MHPVEPAAVAIIIQRGDRFAAVRARQRARQLGFLAGHIDPGESAEVAAIREAAEEGGLTVGHAVILGQQRAGTLLCALAVAVAWVGELRSSEEGECTWATREELTGEQSAYPEWNSWAFTLYDAWAAARGPSRAGGGG